MSAAPACLLWGVEEAGWPSHRRASPGTPAAAGGPRGASPRRATHWLCPLALPTWAAGVFKCAHSSACLTGWLLGSNNSPEEKCFKMSEGGRGSETQCYFLESSSGEAPCSRPPRGGWAATLCKQGRGTPGWGPPRAHRSHTPRWALPMATPGLSPGLHREPRPEATGC